MSRVLLALVVALLIVAPVAHASSAQPCDLRVASSPENARIKATCVDARRLAVKLAGSSGSSVTVGANACTPVAGRRNVFDCMFAMRLGATVNCYGFDRVRGRSRNPRLLRRRITGYSCV